MKSQLMTALSIVGVLGTATTAMAVNTDALATLDPGAIGTATDTLLPGTAVNVTQTPTATPTAVPENSNLVPNPVYGITGGSGTRLPASEVSNVDGTQNQLPQQAVQNPETSTHVDDEDEDDEESEHKSSDNQQNHNQGETEEEDNDSDDD